MNEIWTWLIGFSVGTIVFYIILIGLLIFILGLRDKKWSAEIEEE